MQAPSHERPPRVMRGSKSRVGDTCGLALGRRRGQTRGAKMRTVWIVLAVVVPDGCSDPSGVAEEVAEHAAWDAPETADEVRGASWAIVHDRPMVGGLTLAEAAAHTQEEALRQAAEAQEEEDDDA